MDGLYLARFIRVIKHNESPQNEQHLRIDVILRDSIAKFH